MSNTRTDPGFDQNYIIDLTPAQIAEDVMRLENNVMDIMKRIRRTGVISDMDLKSIQRCHSAIQHGALILSSLQDAKIAIARAKHWGRV